MRAGIPHPDEIATRRVGDIGLRSMYKAEKGENVKYKG